MFVPFDFVVPIVLPAKVFLLDLCRRRLEWDYPIPDHDERNRWLNWLEDLTKLEQLSVDRCLKPPSFGKVVSVQLHHFSDASQQGYGAVSYLRFLDDKNAIDSSFVMGKARTATEMSDYNPEIKKESQALLSLTNAGNNCNNQVLEYFSSWYRLKKFVAWILRYRDNVETVI